MYKLEGRELAYIRNSKKPKNLERQGRGLAVNVRSRAGRIILETKGESRADHPRMD